MSNDKISDVGINIAEKATVIWNVADMLRGPFKPHEYGLVIRKQQYLAEIENDKKSMIYEYVTGKRKLLNHIKTRNIINVKKSR